MWPEDCLLYAGDDKSVTTEGTACNSRQGNQGFFEPGGFQNRVRDRFKLFDQIEENFMGRPFKIGICVAGCLLLGSSAVFGAQARDELSKGPQERLIDAVDVASSLRSTQSIGEGEYRRRVCTAVQGAVNEGVSVSAALNAGGVSACAALFVGDTSLEDNNQIDEDDEFTNDDGESTGVIGTSGGDAGGSGGHAPVTPIVIPATTAGSNDSTSPTTN